MSIELESFDNTDGRRKKEFVKLPSEIMRDDPNWVSPLLVERLAQLHPKHPFFKHAKARFWLLKRDGQNIGRISAQVDQLAWQHDMPGMGFIGNFDCIDGVEVAKCLFSAAEVWLSENGCDQVRGPFSLSINQESGCLIDGFDTPPFPMMGHAMPYYQALYEANGYAKAKDLYAWKSDADRSFPAAMQRILSQHKGRCVMRDFDRKHYKRDLLIMLDLFNDAWRKNWGFIPFTEEEFLLIGKEMMQIVPTDFIKFAEVEGKAAAFVAYIPNINSLIGDLKGKLFPFGFLKLLYRLRFAPAKSGRIALMGIRQEFQNSLMGSTLTFMLLHELHLSTVAKGYNTVEMSWVLEDNKRLNKVMQSTGGKRYKTYRVFEKKLMSKPDE
ncbi:MAG: N-acetyltransferase [Gammaproteobacteria bacterium]|nr:N-acetyltransferase [Gammaproteobacteria bacterium]